MSAVLNERPDGFQRVVDHVGEFRFRNAICGNGRRRYGYGSNRGLLGNRGLCACCDGSLDGLGDRIFQQVFS